MVTYYDELEIEDFAWDPVAKVFHHPCPCGDRFEITKSQLRDGEEIAICPSCSLIVRIVYDYLDWEDYTTTDDEDSSQPEDVYPSPLTTPPDSPSLRAIDDQEFKPLESQVPMAPHSPIKNATADDDPGDVQLLSGDSLSADLSRLGLQTMEHRKSSS